MLGQKIKPYRDKKYREYVASLPCSVYGVSDDTVVGHHLINVGQGCMGGKASDLDLMPMSFKAHDEMHRGLIEPDLQYKWIAETLSQAIRDGYEFKID